MLVKFDHWKNVSGRAMPKPAITNTNAIGSSDASAVRALKIRGEPGPFGLPPAFDGAVFPAGASTFVVMTGLSPLWQRHVRWRNRPHW